MDTTRDDELWYAALSLAVVVVGVFTVPIALALGLYIARLILSGG